jgi:hypothetical protein
MLLHSHSSHPGALVQVSSNKEQRQIVQVKSTKIRFTAVTSGSLTGDKKAVHGE